MIQELKNNMILYHGSYCEVRSINLTKCKQNKDFGQGFYLTTDDKQAKDFARLSLRKAISDGLVNKNDCECFVSKFLLTLNNDLNVKLFENADSEWLHCTVACRKGNQFLNLIKELEIYDIIGGKIADDKTNFTLISYLSELFGEIGTNDADDLCIKTLIPNKLKDQYCFRTPKSIECLKYCGTIYLSK